MLKCLMVSSTLRRAQFKQSSGMSNLQDFKDCRKESSAVSGASLLSVDSWKELIVQESGFLVTSL